ncbi:hypothetical protein JVU11DRAFT_5093 [Chiua virens]|nr:hypothetical protein JVU11DRAFT_5093 [Chiua virens]
MAKVGAYNLPSQPHATKAAADSFEVIVAALYVERGFADVCAWVQEQYTPLIAAARESYDKCLTTSNRSFPFLSTKRHRGPLDPANTPLLKKIRLSSGRGSPRSTLMAQRVIDHMKSKGKVKLCLPMKKSELPLALRLHSCELRTPEPQKSSSSQVIDLTADVESDEEPGPSNAAHVSQPSLKLPVLTKNSLPPLQSHVLSPFDRGSDKCTIVHWPPKQGSPASLSQSTLDSPSPEALPASSSLAMQLNRLPPIDPHRTFEFFRRSGLSLPPSSDNMQTFLGTLGNPIVVEDSETEG